MIINLADNLKMETEIPIKMVIRFIYSWRTDSHAVLHMEGYLDRSSKWNFCQSYDSQIRIWLNQNEEQKTLFFGNIAQIETKTEGNLEHITLKVLSASCLLDQKRSSRSFQNVLKTFGEIVREAAVSEGGQIIRNKAADKAIETPVIRYNETVWQFAQRLAIRLGTCIIPDVITGQPNFWFGMRKGKNVSAIHENQFIMDLYPIGKRTGISYQTEGRAAYSIGDTVSFSKQTLTITQIEGRYEHGELVFQYVMEDMRSNNQQDYPSMAGMGLWGTVREVKGESLRLALDIDANKDTGDYFYPWQPETGNSLYAMPEPGAKALLYFYDAYQKNGAVIHCLTKEESSPCQNRSMNSIDGNQIHLWENEISVKKGKKHTLAVGGGGISAKTKKRLEISAEGSVFLRGRKIAIKTPEELVISQA